LDKNGNDRTGKQDRTQNDQRRRDRALEHALVTVYIFRNQDMLECPPDGIAD
jgi:hypothetical protein